MSKEYDVCVPVTAKLFVTVEAESEEEAIQKALDSDLSLDCIEEWQTHERVIDGNVFYGVENEAWADLSIGQRAEDATEQENA